MGIRRNFIGFTGAVQILLSLVMSAMGSYLSALSITQSIGQSPDSGINNSTALGVPLWCGLLILMCGAGNVVEAFTARSTKKRSQDLLPCSVGAFCANLLAFLASGIIIGIFTWAIYELASSFVVLTSTILLSASIIMVLSILAMFVDCMSVCLGAGPSSAPRPYFVDYEGRGHPHNGFKG